MASTETRYEIEDYIGRLDRRGHFDRIGPWVAVEPCVVTGRTAGFVMAGEPGRGYVVAVWTPAGLPAAAEVRVVGRKLHLTPFSAEDAEPILAHAHLHLSIMAMQAMRRN